MKSLRQRTYGRATFRIEITADCKCPHALKAAMEKMLAEAERIANDPFIFDPLPEPEKPRVKPCKGCPEKR